jgi:glycosyltransferase involved in cell wall biosynthesis
MGLPVFNGQEYLRECLDSLLAQTFTDFELIVSDNASSDATPDIVTEYARHDPRIRFVRSTTNRGVASNHRRVLGLAQGSLFKWCGADDRCAPDFLVECVAALDDNPDAVLAYPRSEVIDEAGEVIARTTEHLPLDSSDVVERFTTLLSAISITHNPYYGVMRRAQLERIRPLSGVLAGDRCLLAELALRGRFIEVPLYLFCRRTHEGNQRSLSDDQRFFHPATPERFRPREWQVLWRHLGSALGGSLPLRTRAKLLREVGAWVVRQRGDLASEARALVRQRFA